MQFVVESKRRCEPRGWRAAANSGGEERSLGPESDKREGSGVMSRGDGERRRTRGGEERCLGPESDKREGSGVMSRGDGERRRTRGGEERCLGPVRI